MLLSHLLQSSVVVPDALVVLITAGLMFLVTQGIKEILRLTGIDLSGYAAALVAALVGIVVAFLNGLLAFIPVALAPLAAELLNLLVLLLSGYGVYRIYRALRVSKLDSGR